MVLGGVCAVCMATDLSHEALGDHTRRHGPRRMEQAKARLAARTLATLPRDTPGLAILRVIAIPRGSIPDGVRDKRMLAAVESTLRDPRGAKMIHLIARGNPDSFEAVLDMARRERPDLLPRLEPLLRDPATQDAAARDPAGQGPGEAPGAGPADAAAPARDP